MTTFPNAKHDDQVDSTAQFLDWFKMPFPGQTIFELYRREFEQLKPRETRDVRLKAPAGIGSLQTLSGKHITIGPGGIVELSAADAEPLIRIGWTKLAEGCPFNQAAEYLVPAPDRGPQLRQRWKNAVGGSGAKSWSGSAATVARRSRSAFAADPLSAAEHQPGDGVGGARPRRSQLAHRLHQQQLQRPQRCRAGRARSYRPGQQLRARGSRRTPVGVAAATRPYRIPDALCEAPPTHLRRPFSTTPAGYRRGPARDPRP